LLIPVSLGQGADAQTFQTDLGGQTQGRVHDCHFGLLTLLQGAPRLQLVSRPATPRRRTGFADELG
jgi:hypothetical protein